MKLSFFDNMSVLVVGDVMLDKYLSGCVRRVSPEAPVPIVEIQKETETLGGAGNVALNLASLGVRVELFGLVGEDDSGENILEKLRRNSIKHDKHIVRPSLKTITKCRVVAQNQQICRFDYEMASENYALTNEEIKLLTDKVSSYDVVIISDYAKGVVGQTVLQKLSKICREEKRFIGIDPKPKNRLDLSGVNLIKPNIQEARDLVLNKSESGNLSSIDGVCKAILERYSPEYLVVTLGEAGAVFCPRNGGFHRVMKKAIEVADVSGAGDTFMSVLTICLAYGMPPLEATELAVTAGSLVVSKFGTATITQDELAQAHYGNHI
jgi:rfaE bifunctional protein kinase chain/domain